MDTYIVQPGDTIYSIADKFNEPLDQFLRDNNLSPNSNISIGQLMIITHPEQTYIVQQGDTINSIANAYGITILEILQNNPYLLKSDYLNTGEELVIKVNKKEKQIEINSYIVSRINEDDLKKALLFSTYATIIGYRVTAQGDIVEPDDSAVIRIAKEYGVAPIMLLATFTEQGRGSTGITHKLFNDEEMQNKIIEQTLQILRKKQLYGINIGFQYIFPGDIQNYINFIYKAKDILGKEGFQVWVSLIPDIFNYKDSNNNQYVSQIGQIADSVVLITYQWSNNYFPSFEQTALPAIKAYTQYLVELIPPEKIFITYTRIAYDYELPYVESLSIVNSLSNIDALNLSSQISTDIGFNENLMTPYFDYEIYGIQHSVWFKDTRTINALLELIDEYNLKGLSIWTSLGFSPQLWIALNQYPIKKITNSISSTYSAV